MEGGNKTMQTDNTSSVCYDPYKIATDGIWQKDNPLEYSLPLFILQLILVVVVTRVIVFIIKPFRQPRVIAEILGGIFLGPSMMGKVDSFKNHIFPPRSVMVLETMANIGLLYFLFLVGVEMDLAVIKRTGKKAIFIALSGMILPFIIGAVASLLIPSKRPPQNVGTFLLFFGISLSVTASPVLARILVELKLLNTELGRLAMSSAIINDMCAWILLAIAIAMADVQSTTLISLAVISSSAAFVFFCIFVIRPAISWIIRRTPEGENFNEVYICLILTGVMLCGFITEAIGTHSIFGAFVFGLVIPNGPLGHTLIEKLEDFVSGLLLPLYFAVSGLNTNVDSVRASSTWVFLFVVIILTSAAKLAATLLISLFYRMPFREGVALGLLMNTKGIIEIIVLNVGKDQKVLDDESFTLMVILALVTTIFVTPTVTAVYKPARRFVPYKRRTIQRWKPDSELRMLACVHTPRNVPTIINLLEASHPTKKSPICVYALYMVELTGRASAMLIVHNTRKSGRAAVNHTQAQSEHIFRAFENYEQQVDVVSVQPLTVISPYSTIHEDICNLAEDKRVALIILPFHKQQTVDGGMEATNPAFRTINQNVLANAPCSVGILVDRGFSMTSRVAAPDDISHHILVLFFGGPDDREALCYASRMAEKPNITLTILRFIPGEDAADPVLDNNDDDDSNDHRILTVITDIDKERQIDDDFLAEYRSRIAGNDSIEYTEKVVNNGEETVTVIRSMDSIHDLYIVGRGQGMMSPLTTGLTVWSECPELGPIGDLLASSDFTVTVSVLVVQQYVGTALQQDGNRTPDSPGQYDEYYNNIRR